ncbi:MAG: Crp/Fnr family transcriptional regulator [Bacillota bacterium]|uniref:Cyclic nucleotide-binding domain-containing protein n=1 Tax=Thermanaerosceptrum fracticalcis TaxID=1712410 RepID=A0A7G6E608_THEFR|nr:Crp/Fnr family transcriptional regulator [Thermanaerosceptrum fracticalcis]QNB47512.1 cyclic nucleotide-binding domain-containing protein [Thermanaerosceptrum fracticalcis]
MNDLDYIKKVPIFAELSEKELEMVAKMVKTRKYRKNMFIFTEGEPGEAVYFVKTGKVKISKMVEDGREHVIHIMQQGDIFGEVVLFNGGNYPATSEVIEDAEVGILRNEDLENLMRQNVDIAIDMLKIMSRRLQNASSQIRDLALKDALSRTAGLLLKLSEAFGTETEEGVVINLSLSRQELANMVGLTRETVTRVLSDLKRTKVIETDKNQITILNKRKLICCI